MTAGPAPCPGGCAVGICGDCTTGCTLSWSYSGGMEPVAFAWRAPKEVSHKGNEDPLGIYIKLVGGGPPVRLTRNEEDRRPAQSPDDRHIEFGPGGRHHAGAGHRRPGSEAACFNPRAPRAEKGRLRFSTEQERRLRAKL
jgi:hypothetical protein